MAGTVTCSLPATFCSPPGTASPDGGNTRGVGARGRQFLLEWCEAARSGFTMRHNIAHGVPKRLGNTLVYMRNPR